MKNLQQGNFWLKLSQKIYCNVDTDYSTSRYIIYW